MPYRKRNLLIEYSSDARKRNIRPHINPTMDPAMRTSNLQGVVRNKTSTTSKVLVALLMFFMCTVVHAAEQWEWTAEVRISGSLTLIPGPFDSQSEAAAAIRDFSPPKTQLLTRPAPLSGSTTNSSISIRYTAPDAPIIIGESVYKIGFDPLLFGPPPDLGLFPFTVLDEAELADAINTLLQSIAPPACADKDYDVILTTAGFGDFPNTGQDGTFVYGRPFSHIPWATSAAQPDTCFVADMQFPFDDGIRFDNVWRVREESCPAGYDQIIRPDFVCRTGDFGTVHGTPHQCEATPISTAIGNPCDATTGSKSQTETDYSSDTLQVTRSYNSHAQMSNSVGQGWTHKYDGRLVLATRFPFLPRMLVRSTGVSNLLDDFSPAGGATIWQSTSGNGIVVKQETPNWRAYLRSGAQELYDAGGNLIELVSSAGLSTTLTRTIDGQIDQVIGPFGKALTFNYDEFSRLTSIDDPAGNPIQYNYGPNDELVEVTYQDSTTKQYHYEDPNLPFHLTGITDENGDRFATYGYDTLGRTILTTHANGFEQFSLVYEPTQTIVTDAAGTEQIYQFTTDPSKLRKLTGLIEEDVSTAIISPAFNVDRQRRPTQFVDANGVITEFEYDDFHLIRKTEAKGTPEERITDFEYLSDDSSLVTLETTQSVFSGGVRSFMTDYGGDNLPDSVTMSGFTPSGDPVQRTTSTTYNSFGKRLTVDGPRMDVNDILTFDYYDCATGAECGQLKSMTNALVQVTTFDNYDARGRLLQTTDPNGLVTTYVYDLRGRLVSVEENSPQGVTHTTLFVYDDAGQLTSTTSPDGLVVSAIYNAAHLLTRTQDSHGNRIDYGYDLRGNQTDVDVFDPLGVLRRAVDNSYDIRNQIASVNAGGFVSTITSDALGNVKEQVDPALATTALDYDGLNRPFRTTDAELGEMLRSFNNLDNIVEIIAPNGAATTFEYDDLGNLLKETALQQLMAKKLFL